MDDDLSALDDFDFDLVQTDQKQNKDSFFATTATENLSTPPSEFGPARRDVFAAPAPVAIAPSSSSSFSSSGFAEPFNPYKRKFGEIMPSSSSSSANDNNNGTHSDLGDVGNFPFLSPEPKRRVTSSSSASASASAATHTNNHSHSVFSLGGLSPVLARPLSPSAQLQREKEALSPVLSYRQSPNTGMPSSLDFNLADLHSTQWATVMQDDLASAVVPSACANVQDFRLAVLGEGSHGHYSRMGAVHLGKDMNLQQVASGGACGSCAKVESLCVMVKALLINESDGAIIACDPFGFMRCALHASILGNVKTMQSIQPGSVLLLKNVTVLKLSAEADPCIIVTNENITKIID